MIGFIIVFSLFTTLVFQVIFSFIGIQYEGSENSPLYKIIVFAINAIVISYICWKELKYHNKGKGTIIPYFIPIIVCLIYSIDSIQAPLDKTANNFFLFFFAFGAVGIFAGTYCYRFNKFSLVAKNIELLMFVCGLALVVSLPKVAIQATIAQFDAGNHQTVSYTAAIAFSIFLLGMSTDYRFKRYRFFESKWYRLILCALMPAMIVVCIMGGGRGGAVLLVVNFLICIYIIGREQLKKILLALFCLIFIGFFISTTVKGPFADLINAGFERSFAFVSDKGIDLESGSSGRDVVYSKALNLILESPLIGYGFFNQYDLCEKVIKQPYAHNIFLEACLQAGVIYALAMITVLILIVKNIITLCKYSNMYYFLIPIATFTFIQLQFSLTYLTSASFWFVLIFSLGMCRRLRISNKHLRNAREHHVKALSNI